MKFRHSNPILYSSNLQRSLSYYTEALAFEHKWGWGDPPTFGGVTKDSVEIFFCEEGQGHPGTWLSILVSNVDEYYETILARGAKIVSVPDTKEWGIREMLVEDPDGHRIRFGHVAGQKRKAGSGDLPVSIRIVHRTPTVEEYCGLINAVGWNLTNDDEMANKALSAVIHAVVAEDSKSGEAVGCALLIGDGATYYYLKDVMVHPKWQAKQIGTALMQALTNWIDENAPDQARVCLITGEGLAPFYQQFGFKPVFAMDRIVHRAP